MTWCEFAREIFRQAGISTPVVPITTAEFGAKARRPAYSVLDCEKFAAATGAHPRPWQEAVAEYLSIVR
jgi:dTDP-4-dehydrorhamnose reductase